MPSDLAYTAADALTATAEQPIPLELVTSAAAGARLEAGGPALAGLAAAGDFKGQAGRLLVVPGPDGRPDRVLVGMGEGPQCDAMIFRSLAPRLPAGDYRLEGAPEGTDHTLVAVAFALGGYVFDRYKADLRKPASERPRLVVDGAADLALAQRTAHACALARDMINTPANDMGPRQIEAIAREIAEAHGAQISVVEGEALLEQNYPAVHAVGRAAAADRSPRLIELTWSGPGAGDAAPLVALVGKGVVFDTGGLDIKPSAGMRLMKKDMGGAAHALALARLVMGRQLPIRLVVLIPAVENAISGGAMRPGDVIASRKGLTIEVGNTDAEGRLILADALARAGELSPDLTIDLATLTGAARVALGPELPPFFTADETLAAQLTAAAETVSDPLWRLPLWRGYAEALNSDIADLANDPAGWAQAGAVTAALFLQRFAPQTGVWAHLDIFAWNSRGRPGYPVGGEAMSIRALDRLIADRYGP